MTRKELIEQTQKEIEKDLESIRYILRKMEGDIRNIDEDSVLHLRLPPLTLMHCSREVLIFRTQIIQARKFLARLEELDESSQKDNNIIDKVKSWFKKKGKL